MSLVEARPCCAAVIALSLLCDHQDPQHCPCCQQSWKMSLHPPCKALILLPPSHGKGFNRPRLEAEFLWSLRCSCTGCSLSNSQQFFPATSGSSHPGIQPGFHVSLLRNIHFTEGLCSLVLGREHWSEIATQGFLLFYSIFFPPVTQVDVGASGSRDHHPPHLSPSLIDSIPKPMP